MLPLDDAEPSRYSHFPFMTVAIIWLNVLIMGFEFGVLQNNLAGFRELLQLFGAIPSLISARAGGGALSSIIAMFLHGGLLHLSGNMLALWVFGRRVEDACGPWRFLFFYLICGMGANIVHFLAEPNSSAPVIGATGAVAGVMGAYILLFPKGRIRAIAFLSFAPAWPCIRAFWVVGYFLLFNLLLPTLDALFNKADYTAALWAHLGGFLACFSVFLFLRSEAFQRYFSKAPV